MQRNKDSILIVGAGGRMKSGRNEKKKRKVLLLCLMLVWGLCPGVRAEEAVWKEYRTTAAEGKLSYDLKSIMPEDRVVDVWSKFEPVADDRIREMKHWVRFDCSGKRMKLLKTITLYRDGSLAELPQKNKFEAIEPGSNPAILRALVCGEKYGPPELGTAPAAKPLQEVLPPVAPQQTAPHEPDSATVEQLLTEDQPSGLPPRQQNTSPGDTLPLAPAALPQ